MTIIFEEIKVMNKDKNLSAHVIRLNRENNRLRASIDKYREFGLFGCLQMREIENKKLKEALTFYADYEVWKEASCSDECFYLEGDCDDDCQGGKLARTVLKELGND